MKQLKIEEHDIKKILKRETPKTRVLRIIRRTFVQLVGVALLFMVFFIIFNFGAFYKRLSFFFKPKQEVTIVHQPVEESTVDTTPTPAPLPDYSPELQIPALSVDAPIIMDIAPNDIVTRLHDGVVQYQKTANPGEIGNMVIVGHSSDYAWSTGHYKTVFALNDQLKPGDDIIVLYKTQKLVYQVTGSQIVLPTQLSVLAKTDTPTLTLLTCYPVGVSNKRLITTAKLVDGQVTGTQQDQPDTGANLPRPR